MIDYELLPTKTKEKLDVKVSTDDKLKEIDALKEVFEEYEATEMKSYKSLQNATESDGKYSFIIPGDEVAEFSDISWDVDNGRLDRKIDEWNEQIILKNLDDA